jgi:hypothetical protein
MSRMTMQELAFKIGIETSASVLKSGTDLIYGDCDRGLAHTEVYFRSKLHMKVGVSRKHLCIFIILFVISYIFGTSFQISFTSHHVFELNRARVRATPISQTQQVRFSSTYSLT